VTGRTDWAETLKGTGSHTLGDQSGARSRTVPGMWQAQGRCCHRSRPLHGATLAFPQTRCCVPVELARAAADQRSNRVAAAVHARELTHDSVGIGFPGSRVLPLLGRAGRYSSARLASVPPDSCDTAGAMVKSSHQAAADPVGDCVEDLAFAASDARSFCSSPCPWQSSGSSHQRCAARVPFASVRCVAIGPPPRAVLLRWAEAAGALA
jgi:hypothetical protein